MIKWKATYTYGHKIEKVEVSRETDSSVFILNRRQGRIRRHAKTTSYEKYFDTWEMAFEFLSDHCAELVLNKKRRLKEAKEILVGVMALTKPE